MKPQVVAWELGKRLRDDAIVQLRQRHHHNLVGAAHSGAARPDAHSFRKPCHHGAADCPTLSRHRSPIPTGSASPLLAMADSPC